jgi:hypothetical protein
MPAGAGEAVIDTARVAAVGPIDLLVLARIACDGGATRAEMARELGPMLQHKLSPAEIRAAIEAAGASLASAGLAREMRGRWSATEEGRREAVAFLEAGAAGPTAWDAVRDIALVAKALGLGRETAARKKALVRPEGLRTLILQKTYGIKGKKNIPDSKLRAQLALVALERAFGNKIKAGFSKGSGLPSKAARTLAGQLSASPREFPTDAKLIAQLAADAVGAPQTDPDALRLALLRRFVTTLLDAAPSGQRAAKPCMPTSASAPVAPARLVENAANDATPKANGPAPRPGLEEFAQAVRRVAGHKAQGWPGNRKAFISQVWDAIRVEKEIWGLSEIEFKCMLTEAHRRGALALANADLRNKDQRQEIERSATPDRNTIWHYVRVVE